MSVFDQAFSIVVAHEGDFDATHGLSQPQHCPTLPSGRGGNLSIGLLEPDRGQRPTTAVGAPGL
jgi:hypothetical protein